MRLLILILLLALIPLGCSTVETRVKTAVNKYCTVDQARRTVLRSQLNAALDGHEVYIFCEGDSEPAAEPDE